MVIFHHRTSFPKMVISPAIPRQWLEARGERFPVESGDIVAKLLRHFGVGNRVVRSKEEVVTTVYFSKKFAFIGGS